MGAASPTSAGPRGSWCALVARWVLGGLFLYLGAAKALHPVDFLKLIRQYGLVEHGWVLATVAAVVPWLEVFCGILLVGGVGVRGVALVVVCLLIPFTLLVAHRALAIHAAGGTALCAIRFDCGCGAGEVLICRKLIENVLLGVLAGALLAGPQPRWCLRATLIRG